MVAPGVDVLGGTLFGGYKTYSGTGYATAFVSAAVALLKSAAPALPAAAVVRRLLATASPSPGGGRGSAYGAGVVDPYRAVTETVSDRAPVKAAPLASPVVDPAALRLAERRARATDRAGWLVFGGVVVVLIAISAAMFIPGGRRRRWRPGRRQPVTPVSLDDQISSSYHVPLTTKEAFTPPSVASRHRVRRADMRRRGPAPGRARPRHPLGDRRTAAERSGHS